MPETIATWATGVQFPWDHPEVVRQQRVQTVKPSGEWYLISEAEGVRRYEVRPCGNRHPATRRPACPLCVVAREVAAAERIRNPIGADLREWIYRRDGHRCFECGSPDDLTVDHVIPVIRGGKTDPDNLRTRCRSCNCRKGAR